MVVCNARVVGRKRNLRLSRINEDGADLERLAYADVPGVTVDELLAGDEAFVVQQLKPGARSLDTISLLEQFEPWRPNAVKSQPREPAFRVTRYS